jgi:hypothetical protein
VRPHTAISALTSALLVAGLATSSAAASPTATATLTALTVTGPSALNGPTTTKGGVTVGPGGLTANAPVAINGDTGHPVTLTVNRGVLINAAPGSTAQLLELKDEHGAPILSVPPFGGLAVYCDEIRVTASDIFNANLTLHWNGSITLNQQHGGATLYSGTDDPNLAPPLTDTSCTAPASPRGVHPGDRYLQTGCSSADPTQCYGTWVWVGGRWLDKG